MQYLITAHDGPGKLEERMSVRPAHLQNIQTLADRVVCAGGILNEERQPVGSVLIMDFETEEQLREYLSKEPYIIEKVWDDVRVEPMNVVILDGRKVGR